MADVATSFVSEIFKKAGGCLIKRVGHELGYLIHYRKNIRKLEQQLKKLQLKSEGRKLLVQAAEQNGEILDPWVREWFRRAEELCEDAARFLQEKVAESFRLGCSNFKKCHKLSKEASSKTKAVVELEKQDLTIISHRAPPLPVGARSTGSFKSFESRIPTMNEMMMLLRDGTCHMISICGMGGAGKTTMVEEVARRVKDEKLFDQIAMAMVSGKPNLTKIQEEIANYLGLELKKTTLKGRADELWQRLSNEKRNLVILDDVWEICSLKEIGIPFGVDQKNCTVVLTSRNKDVCKAMGCEKNLEIEVLSDDEAWSLFGDIVVAGLIDHNALYPIASRIVKRCGGLPIAISIMGKALKYKSEEEWEDTLLKLENSIVPTNIQGMDKKVYQLLKVSYDLLENVEAKKLLLLCCLYPESMNIHVEDLVRYGIGLRFCDGVDSLTQARKRVCVLIEELKSRYLLLNGNGVFTVKVHDLVRAVGISMESSTEPIKMEQFSIMALHNGQWPVDARYEQCNAISLLLDRNTELPKAGLGCPKVEVLQIVNFSAEPLDFIFEGMKSLRVIHIWGKNVQLLPSSLLISSKNLRVLILDCRFLTAYITSRELVNLEILSLEDYNIKELPREIGNLINLRLLDMSGCQNLRKISPGIISRLQRLEELYIGSRCWGLAKEEDNASLVELQSMTNLAYLGFQVENTTFLHGTSFLRKLKRYVISVGENDMPSKSFFERRIFLNLDSMDTDLGGGLDELLAQSVENLHLEGDGINIALKKIGQGSFKSLKILVVQSCKSDNVENVVDFGYQTVVFPQLEVLYIKEVMHLREIVCRHGRVGLGSFRCLREIKLSDLPALTHPFTISVATNLVLLQSLSIQKCKSMEEIVISEPTSLSTTRNRIVFPKLKELLLWQLDSLVCFCQGIDQVEFPQLKELYLEDLPMLLTFCLKQTSLAAEGNHNYAGLQSLFNDKVKFPSLVQLVLVGLKNIEEIWCSQLPVNCFQKLVEVTVYMFPKLVTVFPSQFQTKLPCLEKLEIEECNSMEQLFSVCHELEDTESVKDIEILREVPSISRTGCFEKLATVFRSDLHSTDSPTDLKKQLPVSNGLKIGNLKEVKIRKCHSMKSLFPSFVFKGLLNLQKIEICDCELMEVVVAEEEKGENRHPDIIYDEEELVSLLKLESIELSNLPRLKNFCFVFYALDFPVLTRMQINNCPDMSSFTLTSIRFHRTYNPVLIQDFFGKMLIFSSVVKLQLCGLHSTRELWSSQISTTNLKNLKSLKVKCCSQLVNVFPLHLQIDFPCLEKLVVDECQSLEVVIGCKGQKVMNLKKIGIWRCHRLGKLCSAFTLKGLLNLETLMIAECNDMEEIVEKEPHRTGRISAETQEVVSLIRLEQVNLKSLQSLKCVCKANYALVLPELTYLYIRDCPELSSFSQSSVSSPKLESVNITFFHTSQRMWFGDLNKTFKQFFVDQKIKFLQSQENNNIDEFLCRQILSGCFQNLTILRVIGCHKLVNVFPSNLKTDFPCLEELNVGMCCLMEAVFACEGQSFVNLRKIKIWECPSLVKMCSASTFKGLLDLQTLEISTCQKMEVVVSKDEDKEEKEKARISSNAHEVVLQIRLQNVELHSLPNLKCFCNANCTLVLPELTVMVIKDFSNLSTIPWRSDNTLRLESFTELFSSSQTVWFGDLNKTIKQYSVDEKIKDYWRQELRYESNDEFFCSQILGGCFQKLTILQLIDCDQFTNVFPSHLQTNFPCLQELNVERCGSMEVVFGCEGLNFENLERITVGECPRLGNICSASTFKVLMNLQTLSISSCEQMEVAVAKEAKHGDGNPINAQEVVSLVKLHTVELYNLRRLKCFCNITLELPALRTMKVGHCPEMSTFSTSAVSIVQLKSVEENAFSLIQTYWFGDLNHTIKHIFEERKMNYVLMDSEVDNEEDSWFNQLPSGRFGMLKHLEVHRCGKLVNLFPSHLQIDFPCLEKLVVGDCNSMEVVVDCRGQNLRNLQEISIRKCPCLQKLCSAIVFKDLLNLQTLDIMSCEKMEKVVEKEDEEEKGGTSKDYQEAVSLMRLQTVKLRCLLSLKCFDNASYALVLPELTKMDVEDCPEMSAFSPSLVNTLKLESINGGFWSGDLNRTIKQFFVDEKIKNLGKQELGDEKKEEFLCSNIVNGCFQNLTILCVVDCHKLVNIFPSNLQTDFPFLEELVAGRCDSMEVVFCCRGKDFQNLKSITVWECPRLGKLCSISTFKHLNNLQILDICMCENMELVVAKEDVKEGEDEGGTLIRLQALYLRKLPNLMRFSHARHAFLFPELTKMYIRDCPDLISFSPSPVTTPKLKFIDVAFNSSQSYWFGDLNGTIRQFFIDEKRNYILADSETDSIEKFWWNQLATGRFLMLKVLEVHRCTRLVNVFPSHLNIVFPCLEKLVVRDCYSMEVVFDYQEQNLWSLKEIRVWRCPRLVKICSASTFRGMVNLEMLEVYNCEKMEVVAAKEMKKIKEDKDGMLMDDQDVVSLLRLKTVKLQNLPSLKYFCNVSYALVLPELTTMNVKDCPRFSTFSSCPVSTVQLESVQENSFSCARRFWSGDLNGTIKHIFKERKVRIRFLNNKGLYSEVLGIT